MTASQRFAGLLATLALLPGAAFAQGGHTTPPVTEFNALQISVYGIGPAVEEKVVRKVRSLIAAAYAKNEVDQILTLGYGIEGGMSVCVQKAQFVRSSEGLTALTEAIAAIPHDPRRTSKDVVWTGSCVKED